MFVPFYVLFILTLFLLWSLWFLGSEDGARYMHGDSYLEFEDYDNIDFNPDLTYHPDNWIIDDQDVYK